MTSVGENEVPAPLASRIVNNSGNCWRNCISVNLSPVHTIVLEVGERRFERALKRLIFF